MNRTLSLVHIVTLVSALLVLLLASGCGGPSRPTATALPPDLARPRQPTPAFANRTDLFNLGGVTPAPVMTPGGSASQTRARRSYTPAPIRLPMGQPPTALGIVRRASVLRQGPDGPALLTLPAGSTVTVTGRSSSGSLLAVFTADGLSGWLPTGSVSLFGADDLLTLDETVDMGAIATLIAEAMQPVEIPTLAP